MNDLKSALRALLRRPGFSIIAVVTLALGIGLNTAMFSLTNTMFLRPLPFAGQDSLVRIFRNTPGNPGGDLSAGDFADLRSTGANFGSLASLRDETLTLSEKGGNSALARALAVSANFFDVLQVRPEIGRAFTSSDEDAGQPDVVLISHDLWHSRYHESPGVLGRDVRIGSGSATIIGVLPEWANDGRIIRNIAVFRPERLSAAERRSRADPWERVIGRRQPNLTLSQARAWVAAVGARASRENPKDDGQATWDLHELSGGTGNQTGRVVAAALLGLSACVLLIACLNLANFVVARAAERSQELSVRSALGASLFRLVRPLALESLLLAGAGGLGALAVNSWCSHWLSDQSVASGDSAMAFPVDWRVLAVAAFWTLSTALAFGTFPVLLVVRSNLNRFLKSGGRGSTAGWGHRRTRNFLVVSQFALAMTLLAGAVFLVRGAGALLNRHLGWDASGVAVGQFNLPKSRYGSPEKILAFERELGTRLRAVPGAADFAVAYSLPYGGGMGTRRYQAAGATGVAGSEITAAFDGISPDYFRVTGGRIMAGRSFTAADGAGSPPVAIISESMAQVLFPAGNALGQRLRRPDEERVPSAEIVGIASDVRSIALYQPPSTFEVYHPLAQEPWQSSTLAVRAAPGGLDSVLAAVRASVAAIDPDLVIENLLTADRMVERTSFDVGMLKQMLGAFAGLGLLLAALGIYGVMAKSVAQRTVEIGIRMALGATVGNITRQVLGSGIRLALVGSALGLLGAIGITRLLASVMPGLPAGVVAVIGESAVVLWLAGLLACYLPARAAARVDPLEAIRGE